LLVRQLVRPAEEHDGPIDVVRFFDVETDPAALGQDMVRLGQTLGHDLVPHRSGEWNIDQPVSVDVADLPAGDPVFHAAKPVGMGSDILPSPQHVPNVFARSPNRHRIRPSKNIIPRRKRKQSGIDMIPRLSAEARARESLRKIRVGGIETTSSPLESAVTVWNPSVLE
jgi:hypothetical protein